MKKSRDIYDVLAHELGEPRPSAALATLLASPGGTGNVWEFILVNGRGAAQLAFELSEQEEINEDYLAIVLAWVLRVPARTDDTVALNALNAVRRLRRKESPDFLNVCRTEAVALIDWCLDHNALVAERALDLLCESWERLHLAVSSKHVVDKAHAYVAAVDDGELRAAWERGLEQIVLQETEPALPDAKQVGELIAELSFGGSPHPRVQWRRIVAELSRCSSVEVALQLLFVDSETRLDLGRGSRVWSAWSTLYGDRFSDAFDANVDMQPVIAQAGSLIAGVVLSCENEDVSVVSGAQATFGELKSTLESAHGSSAWTELLATLRADRLSLVVQQLTWRYDAKGETASVNLVSIDPAAARAGLERSKNAPVELTSGDVPQADDLWRVCMVVDMLSEGAEPDSASLGVVQRQVLYYKHAARVLGLIDDVQRLTSAGRHLARLSRPERSAFLGFLFEASVVGEQWISWSHGRLLTDIRPGTARQFLSQRSRIKSEITLERRAQSLEAWLAVLRQRHLTLG